MKTEDFRLLQGNAVQSDRSEPMFRRNIFVEMDGAISQKIEIFSVSAVKGSYPINVGYYFALIPQIPRS
jgi:hypothetical protein